MKYLHQLFAAAIFLTCVVPVPLPGQDDDPVPPSEIIGVLVQFVAGDFGAFEFVGDVRLQNLNLNPCFVTLRFGEGAGNPPSVPLLANGVPVEDGSMTLLVSGERILQIRTAEPDQLFRGSVLAHSSDYGCAGIVSLQGGYRILSSQAQAQGASERLIEIGSIRPGSLLTEEKCVAAPISGDSQSGIAWVGGPPFTRLIPAEFETRLRICAFGDLGGPSFVCDDKFPQAGQFQAYLEQDLFTSPLAFEDRRLRICLQDSVPGESVYVQLGEFQTDRTGNVQTAQPAVDRTLPCESTRTTLCLNQHRFQAMASWFAQTGGGSGVARPLTENTGTFGFSGGGKPDLDAVVQVIDACEQAGHYWVTVASTSTTQFTITVKDLVADQTQEYTNTAGNEFQPVFDTQTFGGCP